MGEVCSSLAEQMARDAEGATKFVRIVVTGARSDADAVIAARAIAASQLVQCSLYGGDPYWGRVLSEIGASGAYCDPERVDIDYGGVTVCRDGIACAHDEAALAAVMAAPRARPCAPSCTSATAKRPMLTTDLSPAYIAENMTDVVTARPRPSTDAQARLADAGAKAAILADALPYIREFAGKIVVVKYGGHAMDDPALAELFATDVVLMRLVGMQPVVVHGGGPQISDLMRRLGKEPEFVNGQRVTDAETVDIVRMVLVGKVNREIVASVNRHGSYAVGLSGEDAGLLRVTARDPALGFVGDVEAVDPTIVQRLLREELIPVIATVGVDDDGQAYNVNADTVAAAIAAALGAEKLVYLTDVAGALRALARRDVADLARRHRRASSTCSPSGAVGEGMIPKVESCIAALRGGVRARTCSTAGCRTHCCSSSSPAKGSERW